MSAARRMAFAPQPDLAADLAGLSLRAMADDRQGVRFECQGCGHIHEFLWYDLRLLASGHSTMTLGMLQAVLVCEVCGEREG